MSHDAVEPRNDESPPAMSPSPIPISSRKVLVTGATSLIGRLVVGELLALGCQVFALLRTGSAQTNETLAASIAGHEGLATAWRDVTILRGDLWEPDLGLDAEALRSLRGVTEIIHLARPRATEPHLPGALVKGHDCVTDLARRLDALRRVIVLSTTNVSGDFVGRFYEDWLDVGQPLSTQSAQEALDAEARAQVAATYIPLCIARHAMLVGHTHTGQMECEAGFERVLAWGAAAAKLPSFLRPPGPAAGQRFLMVSPVDFVAQGLVELAFSEDARSGETFCLADPAPPTLAEVFELVLRRSGGPAPGLRLPVEGRGPIGWYVGLIARAGSTVGTTLGRGPGMLARLLRRGDHDTTNASRVLEPAGILCPAFETYFDALNEGFLRRHLRAG